MLTSGAISAPETARSAATSSTASMDIPSDLPAQMAWLSPPLPTGASGLMNPLTATLKVRNFTRSDVIVLGHVNLLQVYDV